MFANWDKAIQLYREVGDQIALANLLGVMGQFRITHGKFELGEKYLDEALQLWQVNKNANIWDNPKIAKSMVASVRGQYEQAQAFLEEILMSSERTGNRMSDLWARVRLGHVTLHAGNLTEARPLLSESARNFSKDDYTIGTVFSLEGMANLYATIGRTERATQLIDYSDAAREKISDERPPLEQADVDLSITTCITRSDKPTFEKAYEEGIRMSLEDVVQLAVMDS